MNVNKAVIVGRLTRDPEVRTTPGGQTVTNFSLATSTSWKDAAGQKQEKTEFHNIVAWGKRGEVIGQYCTKGQELFVEGRLETRSWDDKETNKKMYRTEIVMDNFEFGQKAGGGQSDGSYNNQSEDFGGGSPQQASSAPKPAKQEMEEEEIPTINLEEEEKVKIEDVPF